MEAEGWFVDPFGAHDARWISDGVPTALVRDGTTETQDAPPSTALGLPLIPPDGVQDTDGRDLLRSDAADGQGTSGDGAFQAFAESGGSFT
jgi:hypothetical protein